MDVWFLDRDLYEFNEVLYYSEKSQINRKMASELWVI